MEAPISMPCRFSRYFVARTEGLIAAWLRAVRWSRGLLCLARCGSWSILLPGEQPEIPSSAPAKMADTTFSAHPGLASSHRNAILSS